MSQKFIKKTEDFDCLNCGVRVEGDGYTNHCPVCLWSLHVDIFPGDRLSDCRGLMKPAGVELLKGSYRIKHVCIKCGQIKKNRISDKDDFDKVIKIMRGNENEI